MVLALWAHFSTPEPDLISAAQKGSRWLSKSGIEHQSVFDDCWVGWTCGRLISLRSLSSTRSASSTFSGSPWCFKPVQSRPR